MSDKAREDYKKAMEQMEAKAEEARKMAENVRRRERSCLEGYGLCKPEGFRRNAKGLG